MAERHRTIIMKISIIIPAFNEEATVGQLLEKVRTVDLPWEKEIIIVNDASTDRTGEIIGVFVKKYPKIVYISHQENQGKGAAVMTGVSQATGDYVVIQDADLEYDPKDIGRLLGVVEKNYGLVVYGSRLMDPPVLWGPKRTPMPHHYLGNRFLSLVTTLLYGVWLTDMETCYKLFPREAINKFKVLARGFEFEPEITAKLLLHGYQITEISITTKPRGYEAGKKLDTWNDGWRALSTLWKFRFAK